LSALSVLAVAPAQAVVLDFDSLPQSNNPAGFTDIGRTYTEDGFTLTSGSPFRYFNPVAPAYTGSVALLNNSLTNFDLTRTDGGTFTFSSIDLGNVDSRRLGATYTGFRADGTTVRFEGQALARLGSLSTNIIPSTFTNLIRVRQDGFFSLPPVQFDNINVTPTPIVTAPPATDVPEPLTILGTLFGAGYSVALKRKLATSQQDKTDIN
jgi:hypothetical protein